MIDENNPEPVLIRKLREAFSNQFEEEFSNNKLSEFFGSKALINETLRKNRQFSERILFRIKKSIEEKLTSDNQENALNALFVYMGGKKKSNSNQPELDLIESLRDIISEHQGVSLDYTNLGRFFDNQTLFNSAINRKTSFKEYIINKIEWIVNQKLDENLRNQALKVLEKYRISKNYSKKTSTPIEDLINSLQESFSNQNNKFITKSEISNLIGGKSLLSYSAKNNSKLYQLSLIKFEQNIEENLTGINKIKALLALKTYKLKIGYSVDSAEKEFVKVLVNTFSNAFQRDIYLTELGELIASKSIFNETLRKKTKFTRLTLDKIEKTILENLKGENLNKALNALLNYKSINGYIDESEAEKSTETKLAESIRRIFNAYYNEVFSYNKIGEILGDRQLFNKIFYEEKVLKKDTINRMIENAKNVLDGESLDEAISVLNTYQQLRRYAKKIETFNTDSKVSEEICRCILEELFHPYKFPTVSIHTFPWLVGPNGGPMHIDGYNVELNLGFEFNGIQHYEIDGFYNKTKNDLEIRQKADSHKEELINKHVKRVIVIPFTVKKKDRVNFIIEKCRKLGIDISKDATNIDLKQIEVRARNRIKNRKIEKNNLKKGFISHSTQMPSHSSVSYPNSNLHRTIIDEDFTDPYLWFSPQIRKAIQSKAESLIGQVHEGVSTLKDFSDPWEEVSIYDRSEFELDSAEEINDTSEGDIIPDQDIEPNSEISEIQDHNYVREIEINHTVEEIEYLIFEQQKKIEDQISILKQINYSENREGDLRPDNFNPILHPVYEPFFQPITEQIPPSKSPPEHLPEQLPEQLPEPSLNPQNINTPQPENEPEPQKYPQNQQEQEEISQVPEQSQEEVGTEQYIEEISDNSNVPDIESVINEPIEEIQTPEPSVSRTEDLSDKTDNAPGDTENPDQEGSKDSPNLDEKDEDSDKDKDEKEEIKDTKDDDKDEEKEKDEKDESNDDADEEKDDEDNESSKENDDDSKEDEEESDDEGQEENNDDMDDFEEDSERGFDPTDIYDPINVIDFSELYPQIPALHSSSIDHSNGDVQIIDVDDFREPFCDIKIGGEDFQERDITEVPHFTSEGFTDDLLNDEINDANLVDSFRDML